MKFPLLWKINMKNKKLDHIKASGFKTPENYLESFDEMFLNRMKESNALKDLQTTGFKVPEGYFNGFDDKLTKALYSEHEVKVIPLLSWKKVAYVSAVAASIMIMVNLFNNNNNYPTFGDLETALIEDYIVEEDFTNEDIASLATEDFTLDNFMDSHLIDSNLEDYILNNATVEDYIKE